MAIRQLKKKKPKVCLVLQGGGALGAYHIGAYKALEEAGFTPDWFAGISIGALNSAILAGNEPKDRLEQLESFWDKISRPETDVQLPPSMATMFNTLSATQSLMFGQPNFSLRAQLTHGLRQLGRRQPVFMTLHLYTGL